MSISRREFLELSLVGSLLTACNRFGIDPTKISIPTGTPTPPIPTEATPTTRPTETRLPETNYVDNRLVRYGYELADWTVNGQRMVKKFPEIAQAVELLTDKKNPAEIISFIELPITFDFIDIVNEFSNLHFLGNAISENQAIMLLTDDSGNVVSAKVWGDIFFTLNLHSGLENSDVAKVLLYHHSQQILDFNQYTKAFRKLLERQNKSFKVVSAEGFKVNEDMENYSVAINMQNLMNEQNLPPFFNIMLLLGGHIRTAIAEATWLSEFQEGRVSMPYGFESMLATFDGTRKFMELKNLIRKNNGIYEWTSENGPPDIEDPTFIDLVDEMLIFFSQQELQAHLLGPYHNIDVRDLHYIPDHKDTSGALKSIDQISLEV